jgi:predicted lysophospholipase L1 biosynthesis ABC-type transport system permease subunit
VIGLVAGIVGLAAGYGFAWLLVKVFDAFLPGGIPVAAAQLSPGIALIALLLGAFAVLVTPREEEPQINVTFANVFIPFPGASSEQVESLVASPMEQVLGEIIQGIVAADARPEPVLVAAN